MLSVTAEAAQYVKDRNQPVHLERSPCIDACCFQLQEAPSVKFGPPPKPDTYVEHTIQGITVFVPRDLDTLPLTLTLNSFLGFKRLNIEGWQLV